MLNLISYQRDIYIYIYIFDNALQYQIRDLAESYLCKFSTWFLQAIIENTQNHQSLANFNHYNRLLLQIIQCQMAGNCKYHCINLLRVFIYEDCRVHAKNDFLQRLL